MNAKELDDIMDAIEAVSANEELNGHMWASSKLDEVLRKLEALRPSYRPPQPSDDGKYCFLEELPSDAPPTLVRSYKPLRFDADTCSYEVDMNSPYKWQFWTVAGWRELTKGVWPCERPEGTT